MSEPNIAVIAEGAAEVLVIEAALRAILSRPVNVTALQPEATRPQLGSGWCGVLKWCREFASRGAQSLETDPILGGFDLYVLHVDADVADSSYADGGDYVQQLARELPALPCSRPCPPASDAADQMRLRLIAWLGLKTTGPKTVLCVPSKAIEAWLAAAVLDEEHALLDGLECTANIADCLAQLPPRQRISKSQRDYRKYQSRLIESWASVRTRCSQAERFSVDVTAAIEKRSDSEAA